jgi:hypothetical protein
MLSTKLSIAAWLAVCAACGSTGAKPGPGVGAAAGEGGSGGVVDSSGPGGSGDVARAGGETDTSVGEGGGHDGTSGGPSDAGAAGAGGASEPTCRPALPVTFRDFNPYGAPGGHEDFEASARGVKNGDGSTFQGWNEMGCGLVEPALGEDGKPRVFTGPVDAEEGLFLSGLVGRQRRVVTGPGCFGGGAAGDCNFSACQTWNITPPTYSIKSPSTFAEWFNTVEGVNIELSGELVLTETSPASGAWSFYSDAFFPLDGAGFGNSPGLAQPKPT